ncbi:MAG: hypothetical protein CSA62_12460 [Planctomycetota bacterium]|nr:MAG: hypothetical protein CSA62_12460 [Planctomycetota bacterium]
MRSKPPVATLLWPGADAYFYCDTGEPKVPVLGFLGSRNPNIVQSDHLCLLHVNPDVILVGFSGAGQGGRVAFDFGRIPSDNKMVGCKLTFQAAVLRSALPIRPLFVLTDAVEVKIGQGYPSTVKMSTVYSYGVKQSPADPDTRFSAAHLSSRAVVLGIN